MNPVKSLEPHGQAIWLDFLARGFIAKGDLQKLIDDDGVKGVTSNPSIFEKAIGSSDEYDGAIGDALKKGDRSVGELYEAVAVEDIQHAADVLKPVYDKYNGNDGFVSLEVSPYLALDTKATIEEAERLWKQVDRKNLMVKVPATRECVPAIQELISQGISINVTLLFSQAVYRQVAEAYIAGLEAYDSGVLTVGDQAVTGPGLDRAMVFQHYSLYPWLTVLDNIRFCRQLKAHTAERTSGDVEDAAGRAVFGRAEIIGDQETALAVQLLLVGREKHALPIGPFGPSLDALACARRARLVLDNGETRVALVVCDLLGAAREVFDEARRLGVALDIVEAGGYEHLDVQRQQVSGCMQQGYDALIIGAVSATGLNDLIAKAVAERRPVIDLINGIDSPQITARVLRGGHRIHELPVKFDPRSRAQGKKIGWRDGVRAIQVLLAERIRR